MNYAMGSTPIVRRPVSVNGHYLVHSVLRALPDKGLRTSQLTSESTYSNHPSVLYCTGKEPARTV